ncbi:MAG: ABC transporter substrate-binding protein [Rhodospirillales bacterium]
MPISTTRRAWLAAAGAGGVALGASRARAVPPISIGLLLDMTGPLAAASEDIAYGFALCLDQSDRRAGGRQLHVVVEDTEGKPARAVERFAKMVQADGVDLVVGPSGSPEALALRDPVHALGVPLLVPNAGASALTAEKCSPFVLRASYAHEQIAAPLGGWLARAGQARTAYVLCADTIAGRDHAAAFRKSFQAAGGTVAGEEFVPAATPDYGPHLGRLKLQRMDAIFASFFGPAAARFLEGVDAFGLRAARICGPGWLVSTIDLPRLGARAAGVVGATAYLPDLDLVADRAFVDAFTARHGRPPSEFAAQGFDTARLLLAGIAALEGNVANRRATAAILARTEFDGARGRLAMDPRTNNVVLDIHVFETRRRPGGEGTEFHELALFPGVRAEPGACQPG